MLLITGEKAISGEPLISSCVFCEVRIFCDSDTYNLMKVLLVLGCPDEL